MLREVEGYSHDEIGALLGISAGTSATRLSRAWSLLRRELKP
jgi:DNA-directed RNA polymerase specialized sigma24 family protein